MPAITIVSDITRPIVCADASLTDDYQPEPLVLAPVLLRLVVRSLGRKREKVRNPEDPHHRVHHRRERPFEGMEQRVSSSRLAGGDWEESARSGRQGP